MVEKPKAVKRALNQAPIFAGGVKRVFTSRHELQLQRAAAARGEDYAVQSYTVDAFATEKEVKVVPCAKPFECTKCDRRFGCHISLATHIKWHGEMTRDKTKLFVPPPARPIIPVHVGLAIDKDSRVSVELRIGGRCISEIRDEVAAAQAVLCEAQARRRAELKRRERLRDAAAEADQGEHRVGSKRRGSYTAKQKLKVLEFFDAVSNNPAIKRKQETFQNDPRAKGVSWTTISGKGKWSDPQERARICRAAGKEHRQSLLRIDDDPARRRQGKYGDMEKEVFRLFKARRARGRRVSPRWLTATSKKVMAVMHPSVQWHGGYNWRRRFAKRHHIGQKRKSNCKNKTWEQSEPVVLRFLTGMRKRLQLTPGEAPAPQENAGSSDIESEPEDTNPERADDEDEIRRDLAPLDLGDSSDSDCGDLPTFESVLPPGAKIASPPSDEQLEFKNTAAIALKGRSILYNWCGLGWWHGSVTRPNGDKGKFVKIDGVRMNATFIIAYAGDQTQGTHCLLRGEYGQGGPTEWDRWVLLEG